MKQLLLILIATASVASAAQAAHLPGIRTPSRNITCLVVPQRPTTHASLLCAIHSASYSAALQAQCIAPPSGLDWHGFTLTETKRGQVVCAGGIPVDARHTPTYATLAYGRTWRLGAFACRSEETGLTCVNRNGHGLFLSRESWRAW